MDKNCFENCPRCGSALEPGFAGKAIGLSFIAPEKLKRFSFIDEDLASSGLAKILPSKWAAFPSYVCRSCKLYLIDYSKTIGRTEAKQMAWKLTSDLPKEKQI